MTCTRDSLGRAWSNDKLDDLLRDPAVQRTVLAAECIGCGVSEPPDRFEAGKVRRWAKSQGRTEPGIALLLVLCLRSLNLDAESAEA